MKKQGLKQNLSSRIKRLLAVISPEPPVAGLEVSDSTLRLVDGRGASKQVSLHLPPGIIEGGRLKNGEGFKAVLGDLYRRLPSKNRKHLNVILTIPANDVFIQTFTLPPLHAGNLEEATELNLQMVSPLNLGQSYHDWQRIGGGGPSGKPVELLGAFVPREIIDGFVRALEEAGFAVAAVEFMSLSLVRELTRQGRMELGDSYLVVEVKPEGVTFALARNGQLLFHSFTPWGSIQGRGGAIATQDFIGALTGEVNTISNFYGSHWGGTVGNLIFIAPRDFQDEIREALKERPLTFFGPEELTSAAGAASRSLLQEEKEISLLGANYAEIFKQNRILSFISLWRSTLITAFGFLLLLSLGADLFLRQLAQRTEAATSLSLNQPSHRELTELEGKASEFNQLVSLIKEIQQEESRTGSVLRLINSLAGLDVKINRVYVPSLDTPITVVAATPDEQAAIEFKNRLAGEKTFANVNLPLAEIIPQTSGGVAFTVYLQVVAQ